MKNIFWLIIVGTLIYSIHNADAVEVMVIMIIQQTVDHLMHQCLTDLQVGVIRYIYFNACRICMKVSKHIAIGINDTELNLVWCWHFIAIEWWQLNKACVQFAQVLSSKKHVYLLNICVSKNTIIKPAVPNRICSSRLSRALIESYLNAQISSCVLSLDSNSA